MSGIVGFVDKETKNQKEKNITKMLEKIVHRGPDGIGQYIDDYIAIGCRSLNSFEIPDTSNQPIYNENKNLVLICDGIIYNFEELKKDLIKKGHIFNTELDIEVIIHGYEQYGEQIVNKLRGMFAFVIWDNQKQELFGARDHFGMKPFYYGKTNKTLFFGSEIKSFLPHPSFIKQFNKESLKPYLIFQYSVLNETFFKEIYKLLPGHYLKYKNENVEIKKYYEVKFKSQDKSISNYINDIKKVMNDSIKIHQKGNLEMGAFLSGGIDSSYIAAILKPKQTFTVGFNNKGYSEINEAKALSKLLKIENISQVISSDEFFEEIKNIVYYSDEPHANLSAVPLYFLSKLTKKHVKTVLSGEGADELFGGYISYSLSNRDIKYQKAPKCIRYSFACLASKLPNFKGKNFLIRNGFPVEEHYIGQASIFDEKETLKIINPKYTKSKTIKEITKPYFDKVKEYDDVSKMQYLDMHLWLPHDILLKADKMTMAHSLEVRMPFLDKEVMLLSSQIPQNYKIKDNVTKYILRRTAKEILPDEWSKRPKIGFPVPFSNWIKEEKYYKVVKELFSQEYVCNFFKQDKILKLLNQHYSGKKNNGRKIWTIYVFLVWYKIYFIDLD